MADIAPEIIIGEAPQASRIRSLLQPTAEDMGFVIVRIQIMGGSKRQILQIMAERPDGTMDIGSCAELSRAFSAVLDVEDPISDAYDLEVSSPGIDRPLTRASDFDRYKGYEVKLETNGLIDGRRRFKGVLQGVEEGEILIETQVEGEKEPQVLGFAFGLIQAAKLILSDDMIRQDLNNTPADEDVPLDKSQLN